MGGSAVLRGVIATLIFVVLCGSASAAIIVDGFTNAQTVSTGPGGSNPLASSGGIAASAAIGGNRLMTVTRTSGNGIVYGDVSSGLLSHGSGPADSGMVSVAYDGNSDGVFDPSVGLGGIDLTEGGINNGLNFLYRADLAGAVISARIYSSATNFSVGQFVAGATGFGAALPASAGLLFSSMNIGGGTGANFSSVRGIVLTVDGSAIPALDLQLQSVVSQVVPEPASLGLLAIGSLMTLRRRR